MIDLPLPASRAHRANVVLLLRPEQAAWLRNHAGRRGVSSFMRQLLTQLMEEERLEIAAVRRRLARSSKGPDQTTTD
ncbi:MAG: hypothetical protein ACRC1L_12130 [Prochlorococcaceae cyanobacterium]|jgi:hypothetical protein